MGALALVAVGMAAVACIPAEEPWQAFDTGFERGETGWTPTAPRNPSLNSSIVSNRVVDLVWRPNQPNSYLGTSLETDDLGLTVTPGSPGDIISVTYGLSSSATDDEANVMPAAGAIRLFAYNAPRDEVDLSQPPDYVAVAEPGCAHACTLQFEVTEPGDLGYVGLVYDTSNGGVQGRVRFQDMYRNDQLILFE